MTEQRLHIPIHLRWGDLDAYNHVNNVSMLKLLEEARVRAFWVSDDGEPAYPTAVLSAGIETPILTVVARQEIEYLAVVPYWREPLDVQMWFGKIGGSSVEICYEVWSPAGAADRVPYVRASAVLVLVDSATTAPVRIPPTVRDAWRPYQGAPLEFSRRGTTSRGAE